MSDALTAINPRNSVTPQTQKAKAGQVANNAGGFVFEVSPETRIRRFLILGTTGGTYYQGERELTKENGDVVIDWATNRTQELVDILVEISETGRAPKQNPTIFALAAAAGLGNDEGRKYALDALPRVARTGTHLFLFARYIEQFRGWGRGLRKAVAGWYDGKDADKLAYQMVKYRQREGWSHRDLLRLAHPSGITSQHKALYSWATQGTSGDLAVPAVVQDFLQAQAADSVAQWVNIVERGRVSWEMLPDAALASPEVWAALLDKGMPMGALIRQLPRLTNLGLLKGARLTAVVKQLTSMENLRKARIHPVNVLIAQTTYASGHSIKGSSTWTPNTKVIDALDAAFYASFGTVEPANKRTMNCLDVSGSMTWQKVGGTHLTDRDVSAAMSLVTLATEPEAFTAAFASSGWTSGRAAGRWASGIAEINISARQRLDDVVRTIGNLYAGGTDCALPMLYAREKSLEVEHFQIWTDSETWAGNIHPMEALRDYRKASGINATMAICATSSTGFSIADPEDSGALDVVGFDSAVPQLLADFAAGRI